MLYHYCILYLLLHNVLCVFVKSVWIETMTWKYVLVGLTVSVAAIAYCLYTSLPDGYSSECTRSLQTMFASVKVIGLVVSVLLFSVLAQFCELLIINRFN